MENALENIVILSTEQHFNLNHKDRHCDLWIVDTAVNLLTANELKADTAVKTVTTFRDRGNAPTNIIMMLPTVLEHHPDCNYIVVRGLAAEDHAQIIQEMPELSSATSQGDTLIFKYEPQ